MSLWLWSVIQSSSLQDIKTEASIAHIHIPGVAKLMAHDDMWHVLTNWNEPKVRELTLENQD